MKRLVLLLLLLLAPVLSAQDVTCNAGDVAWVVDTENADEGIVGGTNTAEYNNTSAPWGIQAVFDEACPGLDIRIVVGANNYNSASASWNNRDAADKMINIDTVVGTETAPIKVTGYATAGGAKALATLDFDKASITGSHGLSWSSVADNYIIEYIRVTDADSDCFNSIGSLNVFVRVEGDNCTGDGIELAAFGQVTGFSSFHDNGGYGLNSGATTTQTMVFGNEMYGNTLDGIWVGGNSSVVSNLIYGNGDDGLQHLDRVTIAFNTIRANTDDGVTSEGASEGSILVRNIITGHSGAGDIGLLTAAGDTLSLVAGNNYGDNATDRTLGGPIWMDDDSSPDTETCTFVSATDFELVTGCEMTFTFPRALTSTTVLKGAVQNSAGGITVTNITQGVAF